MKFYIKDIPETYSVWKWILAQTNIVEISKKMKSSVDATDLINLNHDFNIDELSTTVLSMLDTYGYKGWKSSTGESPAYGGMSLVMNPNYVEDCDPNQQTLGTERNAPTQFFWNQTGNFSSLKNTYYDSYAFNELSPCVADTDFKNFINGFSRSLIRSRIGVINSKYVSNEQRKDFTWHKDEVVFENLRINIPIKTDETFMFEIENKEPTHLKYGEMYSWDTHIPHRVYPTTTENRSRVHIVLGFSPWFDYDPEEQSWTANEFYGEMHPIDMLINGHVHNRICGFK